MPVVPWLALCCDAALMAQLPAAAWLRLAVVTAGLLVMAYRRQRSRNGPSDDRRADSSGRFHEVQGSACCEDGPDSKGEGRQQLLAEEKS